MIACVLAALSLQPPPAALDRRAVLGAAATLLAAPLPAAAKSKARAAAAALQKETAKEQAQAMKEYKLAPRPELVGDATTGYKFKEGTVKDGSTGELASYFKDKGSQVQAKYSAEKARATGASADQARKLEEELEAKARAERLRAYQEKKARKSFDEIEIEKFCATAAGKTAVDNVGRPMCR